MHADITEESASMDQPAQMSAMSLLRCETSWQIAMSVSFKSYHMSNIDASELENKDAVESNWQVCYKYYTKTRVPYLF